MRTTDPWVRRASGKSFRRRRTSTARAAAASGRAGVAAGGSGPVPRGHVRAVFVRREVGLIRRRTRRTRRYRRSPTATARCKIRWWPSPARRWRRPTSSSTAWRLWRAAVKRPRAAAVQAVVGRCARPAWAPTGGSVIFVPSAVPWSSSEKTVGMRNISFTEIRSELAKQARLSRIRDQKEDQVFKWNFF